jgi:hypothetical protein
MESTFTVEKLPDENIIVVTVVGFFTADIARGVYAKTAELAAMMEGPIYRITDIREERTSFVEIIGVLKEATKGTSGTPSDPRIKSVFVGDEKMARVARDVLVKQTGIPMPMFATMEDAFRHVRNELSDRKNVSNG